MCAIFAAIVFWMLGTVAIDSGDCAVIIDKFGNKNTYAASKARFSSSDGQRDDVENCNPVQAIVVSRHGIRYPGQGDVEAGRRFTSDLRRRGAASASVDDLEKVLDGVLSDGEPKGLSKTGAQEQRDLGFRFASRFRRLYSTAKSDEVAFVSSSPTRAFDSCVRFKEGFVDNLRLNLSSDVDINDNLTRFFYFCPRHHQGVRNNRTALREFYRFQEMEYGYVTRSIAKHLNISGLEMAADDIFSMHKIAACEFAIGKSHHWSNFLSEQSLNILEYGVDVEDYWKLGPGYPINYQQSCPLLADIFKHMDNFLSGRQRKKGVFYFGHAETVVPLITLLGLFTEGDALRAGNFKEQRNRTFKTSNISPFSTNVAFVLQNCTSRTPSGSGSAFKVQLLFKEQPIQLRHVCSSVPCAYRELRNYFSEFIDHCNLKERCSLSSSSQDKLIASGMVKAVLVVGILMKFVLID